MREVGRSGILQRWEEVWAGRSHHPCPCQEPLTRQSRGDHREGCPAQWLIYPVLFQTPPQIRPFCQDDFLHSLEHAGPQLTCILKGDWLGLYR